MILPAAAINTCQRWEEQGLNMVDDTIDKQYLMNLFHVRLNLHGDIEIESFRQRMSVEDGMNLALWLLNACGGNAHNCQVWIDSFFAELEKKED